MEPDCYGAVRVGDSRSYLFIPRLPADYAIWMGRVPTTEDFKAKYEVDEVHFVDEVCCSTCLSEWDFPRSPTVVLGSLLTFLHYVLCSQIAQILDSLAPEALLTLVSLMPFCICCESTCMGIVIRINSISVVHIEGDEYRQWKAQQRSCL